jgi:hypothetical protein
MLQLPIAEIKKYKVGVSFCGITFPPIFMKIDLFIKKLEGDKHRQDGW